MQGCMCVILCLFVVQEFTELESIILRLGGNSKSRRVTFIQALCWLLPRGEQNFVIQEFSEHQTINLRLETLREFKSRRFAVIQAFISEISVKSCSF